VNPAPRYGVKAGGRGAAPGSPWPRSGRSSTSATTAKTPCEPVRDRLALRLRDLDIQIADLVALRETIAHLQAGENTAEPDS
jgi:hypothetical protein